MGTELGDGRKIALISGITGQVIRFFGFLDRFLANFEYFLERMVLIWLSCCSQRDTSSTELSVDQVQSTLAESSICMMTLVPTKKAECICIMEI